MTNMADELEYIRASGLKGVKLHPDMQQVNSDDACLDELYAYLSETQLPLLIHCGDATRDFSHPRRLRRALERHPRLRVVAAHLGGWSHWDEALQALGDKDCYLDASSCAPYMSRDKLLGLIRAYGAERVLFGTDFPVGLPKDEVEVLMSLPLSERERECIAWDNARRLLALPCEKNG
jgi:predicted TIM-barrel fold metal-dependent hydrolase